MSNGNGSEKCHKVTSMNKDIVLKSSSLTPVLIGLAVCGFAIRYNSQRNTREVEYSSNNPGTPRYYLNPGILR